MHKPQEQCMIIHNIAIEWHLAPSSFKALEES